MQVNTAPLTSLICKLTAAAHPHLTTDRQVRPQDFHRLLILTFKGQLRDIARPFAAPEPCRRPERPKARHSPLSDPHPVYSSL